MLTIGEFSKICKVTTRTLRHYDHINLIKPVKINEENNYRLYDVNQVRTVLFINRLKRYNFSLEEIKEVLLKDDNEFTKKKIKEKKLLIQKIITDYEKIQKNIDFDLDNLEKGFDIMSFIDNIEVKLVDTKDMNIVSSRQIMSTEEYGKYIGKVFEIIAKNKLTVVGAPMSIYYDEEFNHSANDTEVAVPVKETTDFTRTLAGGKYVMTVIKGPYSEKLSEGYAKLTEWIEENNYKICGSPYEKYITGPMDGGEIVTEIYMPVEI